MSIYYEVPFDINTCTSREVLATAMPLHDRELHSLADAQRSPPIGSIEVLTLVCTCGARTKYTDEAACAVFGFSAGTVFDRLARLRASPGYLI